jgi:hypothetical protein
LVLVDIVLTSSGSGEWALRYQLQGGTGGSMDGRGPLHGRSRRLNDRSTTRSVADHAHDCPMRDQERDG